MSLLDKAFDSVPDPLKLTDSSLDTFGLLQLAAARSNQAAFDAILSRIKHAVEIGNRKSKVLYKALTDGDGSGATPLQYASFIGRYSVVETLLNHGVDPNQRVYHTMSELPLHLAAFEGHIRLIELLVERKADINAISSITMQRLDQAHGNDASPLLLAILGNQERAARRLLELGASVVEPPASTADWQYNPMSLVAYSIERGLTDLALRFLLPMGAKLTDHSLCVAIMGNHLEAARSLVELKCDPNYEHWRTHGVKGPLLSISLKQPIEFTRLLLEARADPNRGSGEYTNPLKIALDANDWERARLLMQYGAKFQQYYYSDTLEREALLRKLELFMDHGGDKAAILEFATTEFCVRQLCW